MELMRLTKPLSCNGRSRVARFYWRVGTAAISLALVLFSTLVREIARSLDMSRKTQGPSP